MALAVVGIQVKVGGVQTATKQFEQLRASVDAVVRSVKQLSNVKAPNIKNLNVVQGGVGVFDQKSINNAKTFDNSIKNVGNSVKVMGNDSRVASTKVRALGTALKGVGVLATITAKFGASFGKAIRSAGVQMSAFGRRLTTFGSVLSTFGFRLTAFLSLPIFGAVGGAIKSAIDFEDALVSLETKVGLSSQAVRQLGDAALALAPSLGVDPVELLTAAYQPLSRGIRDTGQAMDILVNSAKASAIGLGEVSDIAKLVTSVMVAYGGAAGSASHITDVLVSAIQFGSAEADELVEPMGRAIGLASGLGVSFEELTAAMGTFAATGAPVTSVVTGINRVLASFVNPAQEAKDAYEAIGTSVKELEASIRSAGLAATIVELSRALADADIPLSDVFGRITGLNAVMFLAGNATDLYLETLNQIKLGAGSLEDAFAIVAKSTSFQLESFKASLKATGIIIGDILLPALNKILSVVTPVISAIGQFARLNPKIVLVATAFALVVAAIGPVIIFIGILTSSVGVLIAVIGSFLTVVGTILAVLTPIGAAILAVVATIGVLFVALKLLTTEFEFTFENIASRALAWGQNIMISIANGLAQGLIFVVQQLIELGNLFAYWLAPGSAPRLLPDLESWGSNIVNTLLDGFTLADFNIFDEIASTIESFIRSIGSNNDTSLIPNILESRQAIADAIAEMKELGHVTASTMDRITASVADAAPGLQGYVNLLLDLALANVAVAAAQEEVNRINEEFEATVKPLKGELSDIAGRFEEVKRAQEREALQAILDDPRAPELAKELALLQLRRLELNEQVSTAEDQRDIELEVANARLEAAQADASRIQEQVDLQKAAIDLQIEQNNLVKEQIALLDRLAKAAAAAAKSGGAAGPGGFQVPTPETKGRSKIKLDPLSKTLTDIVGEGILGAGLELQDALGKLAKTIQKPFEPLLGPEGLIAQLAAVWGDVFDAIEEIKSADFGEIARRMFGTFIDRAKLFLTEKLPEVWNGIVTSVQDWLGIGGEGMELSATDLYLRFIDGFSGLTTGIINFLVEWVADTREYLQKKVDFEAIGKGVAALVITGLEWLTDFVDTFLPEFQEKVRKWFDDIDWAAIGNLLVTGVLEGFANLWDFLTITLPAFWTDIKAWFKDPERDWGQFGRNIIDGIIGGITSLLGSLVGAVVGLAEGAVDAWNEFWSNRSPSKRAEEDAKNVVRGYIKGIESMSPQLAASFAGAASGGRTAMLPVGHEAMASGGGNKQFQIGPNTISNGMDEAIFAARVRRIVAEEVR